MLARLVACFLVACLQSASPHMERVPSGRRKPVLEIQSCRAGGLLHPVVSRADTWVHHDAAYFAPLEPLMTAEATMKEMSRLWAVVLAGGEGRRLARLTKTSDGVVVPKQFCSLMKSSCLFEDALERARSAAPSAQVCAVVGAPHRRWWTEVVGTVHPANVFVQPENRGTGYGILLALLRLEANDPSARVMFLPADHYFRDEDTIKRTLKLAGLLVAGNPGVTYLFGTEPDSADPELGYIVPTEADRTLAAGVARFEEKPTADEARNLVTGGALWNLFIVGGTVRSMLGLFNDQHAEEVSEMRAALQQDRGNGSQSALAEFYTGRKTFDFSREILQCQTAQLRVIRVPPCGWTDLGTPHRVASTVREISLHSSKCPVPTTDTAPFLDLGRLACIG
jgi:mannose-1-phosphate guanylyltransferase